MSSTEARSEADKPAAIEKEGCNGSETLVTPFSDVPTHRKRKHDNDNEIEGVSEDDDVNDECEDESEDEDDDDVIPEIPLEEDDDKDLDNTCDNSLSLVDDNVIKLQDGSYLITFSTGDTDGGGHRMKDIHAIKSNLSPKDFWTAFNVGKATLGFDIRKICSEYEDSGIKKAFVTALNSHGFQPQRVKDVVWNIPIL
jgi:hypothetical protein